MYNLIFLIAVYSVPISVMAQDQTAAGEPGLAGAILPILLIFAVFYFVVFRPQSQQAKKHREMVANLKKGDNIITSGGIYGKIVKVNSDKAIIDVRIADDVIVQISSHTITDLTEHDAGYKSSDTQKKKTSAKKKAA